MKISRTMRSTEKLQRACMARWMAHYYALAAWLFESNWPRELGVCALQLGLIAFAGVSAFLLRFEFAIPAAMRNCFIWGMLVWVAVYPPVLRLCGVVGGWRHFCTHDLGRLLLSNSACLALGAAILPLVCPVPFPHSILLIEAMIYLLLSLAVRAATRVAFETAARADRSDRRRTLIYGAGHAGVLLLREARTNPNFPHEICGFIDDRTSKNTVIQGVKVLGGGSDLSSIVKRHGISQILIAIPSATGAQMREIISRCRAAQTGFRTMPPISEILLDRGLSRQIRDVAVEDLLGRGSVRLDDDMIRAKIEGRVVLVTGAAGSIGSELCRQVARYRPALLAGFDLAETALFYLEREMAEAFPRLEFRAEVGSIQNYHRLRELFAEYRPTLVLHAAAYKHVPMMEKHMFEAADNNILGSWNLGRMAGEFGAEDFVMISSDKAVNPTNVMGASKRAAELFIRSLQDHGTRYVSVRFGNVLGSNGSVVPIFKKQIAAGGPVTITHPDMERYFMTIAEAAQLVLQACAMGRGGEIFVLDMGKPVKIVELARQLIRLSGFEPEEDIPIEFTGMRPGEKLFEELNTASENMLPTYHDKIKIFSGSGLPADHAATHLRRIQRACEQRNAALLLTELKAMVPEYRESVDVQDRAFTKNLVTLGRVLEFNPKAARAEAAS
jgi:FlaA1/EpsC-like NDP-sugar epimerase